MSSLDAFESDGAYTVVKDRIRRRPTEKFLDTLSPAEAEKYGPFTRLRPQSDTIPADLGHDLAAELRATAPESCGGHWRIVGGHPTGVDFEQCERPDCVRRRALLARYDATTGGTP